MSSPEVKSPIGQLKAFSGKPLPFSVTNEENSILNSGKAITKSSQDGSTGGRGFALQDIHASPSITLDTIADFISYPKYVPSLKKVTVYDQKTLFNGNICTKARFDVRVFGIAFTYFLDLTKNLKENTLTWTLDYAKEKENDFEDNVGHWQVMKHPSKKGYSRVLFSTECKFKKWLPKVVVNYLTKTAIIESTHWVKNVAEKSALKSLMSDSSSNEKRICYCNLFQRFWGKKM